tara:strand:+ start:1678 stop:1986 length:309 start_codon:yes stop_codon:yes gene_type:complete
MKQKEHKRKKEVKWLRVFKTHYLVDEDWDTIDTPFILPLHIEEPYQQGATDYTYSYLNDPFKATVFWSTKVWNGYKTEKGRRKYKDSNKINKYNIKSKTLAN